MIETTGCVVWGWGGGPAASCCGGCGAAAVAWLPVQGNGSGMCFKHSSFGIDYSGHIGLSDQIQR